MASVGTHIRRIRTERHMTQEQLAEKLFVTRQAISAWETGRAQPDVETLEQIAEALGVEVTEVIYGISQSQNLRRLKRRWALIGGAFATISISDTQIGAITADMVKQYLDGTPIEEIPAIVVDEFTMVINQTTADEIGIELSDEVLNAAVIVD